MNLRMPHERLVRLIGTYARAAIDARQVTRRLVDFLPRRLVELRREYGRQFPYSIAERHALLDQRYLDHVDELVSISDRSTRSRILYETHEMLFKARQSMRIRNARR